ncbi:receiver/sensor box histidine kinase [Halostagnicola bangensis]
MTQIRVLSVDDDPSFADLTATHLERERDRLEVSTETTVEDAVAVLEANASDIDCIVSEYELSERDGLEFLQTVRREYGDLPFILFTGTGSEKVASDAITAGVTDYLPKGSVEQFSQLATQIHDGVERHRARQAAERSERQLQELAEKSNDMLWMSSSDWQELIFVSDAVEDLFGLTPDQLRKNAQRFLETIHSADRERVRDAMDRLSAGHSVDIECRVSEIEDETRWVWMDIKPVFDDDGTVERTVGFVRDITEHREREEALQALNDVAVDLNTAGTETDIYGRTIDASEDILKFDLSVIDTEEDGRLTKAAISENVAQAETASMSIEEGIAGKTYRTGESMLIEDIAEIPEANPQGPFQSGISIPVDTYGVFQAVAEVPGLFDETDLELAELLISHTISALDRLEREQQLQYQNDRLEKFTQIVSHDLRNPLNVLDGSLELASEECDSPHIETATEMVTRMETIIEDTLTLTAEGTLVNETSTVNLESITRDCWQTVSTAQATLTVDADAEISAARGQVYHIFENVFRNAVEHGGSEVTVRVGDTADGFYIEDDGRGIPDRKREQVLELGYTDGGGSGFGLAIVEQIAEAHGWTVRVTDGTDGGARFEFEGVESQR